MIATQCVKRQNIDVENAYIKQKPIIYTVSASQAILLVNIGSFNPYKVGTMLQIGKHADSVTVT